MRRQLIRTLDYLDGKARLPKDVPPGTPILVDPLLFQIPMLDDTPGHPISYSSRMNGQLKALLSSPGITADIRTLALQADSTLLKNMQPWLEEVHKDAVQLIHMNDAQLQQPAALSLLDDMQTYTNYAFAGRLDPATNDVQPGVVQVYYDIQRLAVFNIIPYGP